MTYLNKEIAKLPSKHPLRGHATIVDTSNDIQASLMQDHYPQKLLSMKIHFVLHIVTHFSTFQKSFLSAFLFKQNVLILFLDFFIGQRSFNLTLDQKEQVHADGIALMEAAKAVFSCRNGSQSPDETPIGWNVWKFHLFYTKLWIFYYTDGQKT